MIHTADVMTKSKASSLNLVLHSVRAGLPDRLPSTGSGISASTAFIVLTPLRLVQPHWCLLVAPDDHRDDGLAATGTIVILCLGTVQEDMDCWQGYLQRAALQLLMFPATLINPRRRFLFSCFTAPVCER